jgi:hypothetical protein
MDRRSRATVAIEQLTLNKSAIEKSDQTRPRLAKRTTLANLQGSQTSLPGDSLAQRSIALSTLMSSRAQHFDSNQASSEDYDLSSPCDDYTFFISHSWHAPRIPKWLALLFRFSLVPALLAAHAVALLTVVLFVYGVLPAWSHATTFQRLHDGPAPLAYWAHALGAPAFVFVLLTFERVYEVCERYSVVAPCRCFLE